MDDIVIFASSEQEHEERLDIVMKKLSDAGITLNKAKCDFKKQEISFLRHIVGCDGIKTDPAKVSAINNFQKPKTV